MLASLPRKDLLLALVVALMLAAVVSARAPDPEPTSNTRGEIATPAVDLEKAKTDRKLAAGAARNEASSRNKLSRLGIALHNYHAAQSRLPTDVVGTTGKALLSWRVELLPHLGEGKLYKEFKRDEPWDGKHNRKLIVRMPDAYRSPRVKVKTKGSTVYQVFTGPNAVFGRAGALTLAHIPDGTSNTIFAVESSEAVPWTKPGGIPFDRKKALPDFGKAYGKRPLAVMFDGSSRLLDLKKIQAETLKNAIDPADGNVLGKDWE